MNNTILEKKKRVSDRVLYALIQLSSFLSIFILLVIIGYILYRGIPAFDFSYLVNTTSIINDTVGILPNIINTLYIVIVTLLIACPIGIGGAIYLNEYTKNKKFVSIISFTTEVLAGIPSIIYGLFGMLFFGSFCQLNFSILTGSLTLALGIIEKKTGVLLPNDEAGFIALHIVNGQLDEDVHDMYEITKIMQEIENIVRYRFKIEFNEESAYYYCFITHLKFFAQRLVEYKKTKQARRCFFESNA